MADDRDAGDEDATGDRDDTDSDRSGGPRFWLPPVKLPRLFPGDLHLEFPVPVVDRTVSVTGQRLLVAAVLFDLLDAWLALADVSPVVGVTRTAAGTLLAALFAGPVGVAYAWEVAAVAAGVGWATVVPSLTVLLLLRSAR